MSPWGSSRRRGRRPPVCHASRVGPDRTGRPAGARCRKNEIARCSRHVVGVTAAAEEGFAFPGGHIQDRHLRGIKAAVPRGNREQYRFSAGQPLGPCVIGFALLNVRSRENRRDTTGRRDSLQTGGAVRGRKDDGIVGSPRAAECGGSIERGCCDGNCEPAADRYFFQQAAVCEGQPLAVRREKWSARQARYTATGSRLFMARTINCVP